MAKLLAILVCFAVFQAALSLKCYNCDDCEDISKAKEIDCPANPNKEIACFKKEFMMDNKMHVSRLCGIATDKDILCRPKPNSEVKFCETCTDNLCNSAPKTQVGVISFVSVVTLLLAKIFA